MNSSDARVDLSRVLARVAPLVQPGRRVAAVGGDDNDVAVVATGLLTQAYLEARATQTLLGTENPEMAMPIIRTLFEGFGELHHLLTSADPRTEAATAFAFALLEIERTAREQGRDESEMKEMVDRRASFARVQPAAAAQAELRRNYWTPGSRKELVERAFAWLARSGPGLDGSGLGGHLYKLLSWDSHHVMPTLQRVDAALGSVTYGQVVDRHPWDDHGDLAAFLTGYALDGMLRLYTMRYPDAA